MSIAVITTFPNNSWDVYAKRMLQSFVQFWPAEIPLMVQLDNDLLYNDVNKILRPQDGIVVGWEKEHDEFVERNKGKDEPQNYRKQAVRFCHKVFAIKRAYDAMVKAKAAGGEVPRYLIWMDADVLTNKRVTIEDVKECLPKEGHAVSYLGRKDWDHSECGWLGFDLEKGGELIVSSTFNTYVSDELFKFEQWHDSYVFDKIREQFEGQPVGEWTNLTDGKPGMDIWVHSPMAKWSMHYKGPVAKQQLVQPQVIGGQKVLIQTKNSIPAEEICKQIKANQKLIKDWIKPCKKTSEQLVVVSAGPMLIAEDVRSEVKAGRKVVAVKHALVPLKRAGITPWACILLDPRPHVADFVKDADPEIIWFVASQVHPTVTERLLERGCRIWGYHASVGAGESELTKEQFFSVVNGGSATATRGLYMLGHLGFKNFRLYGYDLCLPDKPDLNAMDENGTPRYLELSIGMNDPNFNLKRLFFSEPQLIAQFEEMNEIIKTKSLNLKAFGDGIIPFVLKSADIVNLRNKELRLKMFDNNPPSYLELLNGRSDKSDSRIGNKRTSSNRRGTGTSTGHKRARTRTKN